MLWCRHAKLASQDFSKHSRAIQPIEQKRSTTTRRRIRVALSSRRKKQKQLLQFAQDRDLVVVADEAYEDLVYDGEHFSIASLDGMFERTITCFTFSKSYAMTGWRLGYAVAPEPWMTGLRKATLYSSNGVSTPTQWAGLAAMSIDTATLEEIKDQYRVRRDLLLAGLNDIGLPCKPPQVRSMRFLM